MFPCGNINEHGYSVYPILQEYTSTHPSTPRLFSLYRRLYRACDFQHLHSV